MKILLIYPKPAKNNVWDKVDCNFHMLPLGLTWLAAVTPKEHEVKIINEAVDGFGFEDADLVGISTKTYTAKRGYEIAKIFRERGVKVVIGGPHVSYNVDEALRFCDSVVVGEAEEIWPVLINDVQNGKLKKIYKQNKPVDIRTLPPPKKSLLKKRDDYLDNVQTSRGCPINCDFCIVSEFSGRKIRHRPINKVVEEIKEINDKFFYFADDNIVADPIYAKNLFRALIPLNKYWIAQSSILIGKNRELLDLAVKAGCKGLFVGFESIDQENLNEVHKAYKTEEYKKIIKMIHDRSIAIIGAFVFGFDHENPDIFEKTYKFLEETGIEILHTTCLTPLPGTRLFKKMKDDKRIVHYDWNLYNFENALIEPKGMTVFQLEAGRKKLLLKFYDNPLKRIFKLIKTLGLFPSIYLFLSSPKGVRFFLDVVKYLKDLEIGTKPEEIIQ